MQLYLIIAAVFLIWSGAISSMAYIKGSANQKAKSEIVCMGKLQVQDHAITRQKTEATKIIAIENKAVQDAEQKLRDAKDNQEVQDAKNRQTVAVLTGRVNALADVVGRLRDPSQTDAGCGDGGSGSEGETPTSASNRCYNRTKASRLLSTQLSSFLREQASSCDEVNLAYISCRADAFSIMVNK